MTGSDPIREYVHEPRDEYRDDAASSRRASTPTSCCSTAPILFDRGSTLRHVDHGLRSADPRRRLAGGRSNRRRARRHLPGPRGDRRSINIIILSDRRIGPRRAIPSLLAVAPSTTTSIFAGTRLPKQIVEYQQAGEIATSPP